MDFARYASGISFRFLQPDAPLGPDERFLVARQAREPARLLELPERGIDLPNTALPDTDHGRAAALRELCEMPRMSTLAVAALIDRAVAEMDPDQAFVNVGVWNGFSLLSGMLNNPEKTCIGVDNFSEFGELGNPREAFLSRFGRFRSPSHSFNEMDYRRYFSKLHEGPIGLYFYDGDHSYEHQLRGLQLAERFFGDECIVMVDDTNGAAPRQATADFLERSEYDYEVLLDESTTANGHPTWWNGLLILQRTSPKRSRGPSSIGPPASNGSDPPLEAAGPSGGGAEETAAALVSIIVYNNQRDEHRLQSAIEACLEQHWPRTEVLVADDGDNPNLTSLLERYGNRILSATRPISQNSALTLAAELTTGTYLSVVDVDDPPLGPDAIETAVKSHRRYRTVMPSA